MLPCLNPGGNSISIEQLSTPLMIKPQNLESPIFMSISAFPSTNPSLYPLPYFNPSAPQQSPSPFTLLANINNISPQTTARYPQDPSVPQFTTSLDPLKQQLIVTSFSQQTEYLQQAYQMIPQNLSFCLQRATFEDISNFNSYGQSPQIYHKTTFIQSDQMKRQRMGASSSQGYYYSQNEKNSIPTPSLDDLPRHSTELNIQVGSEQVLPRSSSDTQAHTNDPERFKLQRTTSDQIINLKRKINSLDSSRFVETLTHFKSNPFNNSKNNNNNSTSSRSCYYRDLTPDALPINIFTTVGDSSNSEFKFQSISHLQRSQRCSIFDDAHQKQHLQHQQSNQSNNEQTNQVTGGTSKILSGSKNPSKHLRTGSSNKKELLAQLSMEDQSIISAMKQSKKFNFSKNVIKQFLKVFLKTSYVYEADSLNSGQLTLNNKPSFEHLLEFRKQLPEFLAGCSFKHSAIKRIIQHPYFSLYFKDFLRDHTEDWLAIGKTKYKNEQRIMILFLRLCVENPKLLVFLSEHDYCTRQS